MIIIYITGLIGIIMGLIWLTMVYGRYIMIIHDISIVSWNMNGI